MKNVKDAEQFLNAMFAGKPSDKYVVLWRLPSKRTTFHKSLLPAAKNVEEESNVYFGCGLANDKVKDGRGKLNNVGGITAVWLDVDYQGDAHKKENIPPDESSAMEIINGLELEPTIVVHSGHGLQAYWILSDPWIFQSDADRKKATAFTKNWNDAAKFRCSVRGWDLDAVFDLTRVMRLPGSVNAKIKDHEVPVRILKIGGPTYTVDQIRDAAGKILKDAPTDDPKTKKSSPPIDKVDKAGKHFSAGANPPTEKFMILCDNNKKFKDAWFRKRRDLQDQSPSAYDMSLAVIACQANWSDQEIIDLLIASRRTHGNDLKLDRVDYYLDYTIPKARAAVKDDIERASTIEDLETSSELAMNGGTEEEKEEHREDTLSGIRKILKLPIKKWIQRGREPRTAQFCMILDDGRELLIGKAESMLQQSKFQAAIYVGCQKVLPTLKTKDWKSVCQSLAAIVQIEEIEELDRDQQVREWIRMYCSSYSVEGESFDEELKEAFEHGQPFIEGDQLHVSARGLLKYTKVTLLENIVPADLYSQLSMIGFRRKTVSKVVSTGKPTSRSYYVGLTKSIFGKTKDPEVEETETLEDEEREFPI